VHVSWKIAAPHEAARRVRLQLRELLCYSYCIADIALRLLRCGYCVAATALQLLPCKPMVRQIADDRRTSALQAQRHTKKRVA
jgi:hypothetical protein